MFYCSFEINLGISRGSLWVIKWESKVGQHLVTGLGTLGVMLTQLILQQRSHLYDSSLDTFIYLKKLLLFFQTVVSYQNITIRELVNIIFCFNIKKQWHCSDHVKRRTQRFYQQQQGKCPPVDNCTTSFHGNPPY